MTRVEPQLESTWKAALADEFSQPYMADLKTFLHNEQKLHTTFPKNRDIFNAFNLTPIGNVKVVILGQDPYHGDNQAHGLAFSVQEGVAIPPSLVNIYKELHEDLSLPIPDHGNLTKWAKEGVLLLNTVLTVRAHEAHSHRGMGWERFTDEVIKKVNAMQHNCVFILWGKPAQSKKKLIDSSRHLILEAPHPSPLSAYRGFFGSRPFSRANRYLQEHNRGIVDWRL